MAIWVSLSPLLSLAAAESETERFRCDARPPSYQLRTGYPTPDPRAFQLEAKQDSEIAKKSAGARAEYLEENPGGGHSRLGQRYLARVFGYPGELSDGTEVAAWLAAQERSQPRMRGITKLWEKWSKDSRLLLTVVDYDEKKSLYDSERLFHGAEEEGEFLGCVAREIAELKCENTSGTTFATLNSSLTESPLVYYHPDPNAQVFCEVRKPKDEPLWFAQYSAQVKAGGQRSERRSQNSAGPTAMDIFEQAR